MHKPYPTLHASERTYFLLLGCCDRLYATFYYVLYSGRVKWADLTSPEFAEAAKQAKVVILVAGAVEAHGEHLPLGTDTLLAWEVAQRAVQQESALLLPPLAYGVCWSLSYLPGTISLRQETATALYQDILEEIVRNGVDKIVVVNGHGGNNAALRIACQKVAAKHPVTIVVVNWWIDLVSEDAVKALETYQGHAGEDETSAVLYVKPDAVRTERAKPHTRYRRYRFYTPERGRLVYGHGVHGHPEKASVEKGRLLIESAVQNLVALIRDLKAGKLPIVERG